MGRLNLLKSNGFWLFLAVCLILSGFTLFYGWAFLVTIWFGLFFLFRLTRQEAKLSVPQHRIYLAVILLYPLAETAVKLLILHQIIPHTWFWVNRLEHFTWAAATVLLFLPVLTGIWTNLQIWQRLLVAIGLICFLGNLVEFMEFFQRSGPGLVAELEFANYYRDTLYDMMVNLAGSIVGFAVSQSVPPMTRR